MKKKLKKKVRIIFRLLIIALIITSSIFIIKKLDDNGIDIANKIIAPKEVWPKVYNASFIGTGDALLHNPLYNSVYDKETNTFDFTPQVKRIKEYIKDYDIKYYNQETVFGGIQKHMSDYSKSKGYPTVEGYSSYPMFNSPSAFGDAMMDAGFNLVSLATNHSADCTYKVKECIENSLSYWETTDANYNGFNKTKENTNNYIISEINGITYTLLNYSTELNGLDYYIKGQEYLINMWDEEKALSDIQEVRDKVDVLIVAMHWHTGSEYTFTPTNQNKEIAKFLADNGVDIVLGTYSHCLQPYDKINDTHVFYSLGNFISNQGALIDSIGYKGIVGMLATLDITKTVYEDGTKEIIIDNPGAELIYTYNVNKTNYEVIPFSQMEEKYNSKYKSIYEEYSKVLTKYNDSIKIVPLKEESN